MADFAQAIKWMKEGKKVNLDSIDYVYYIIEGSNIVCLNINDNSDHGNQSIRLVQEIDATDWKILKAKSLSDKEWSSCCFRKDNDPGYAEKDIKESIHKFLEEAKKITECKYDFYWLAEKIFGERLV